MPIAEFRAGEEKGCAQCERVLPLAAFYRRADGRPLGRCRACIAARARARRAAGLTQAVERARYHRSRRRRLQGYANTQKWRARNAEKIQAEHAVRLALRRGQLVRQPCAVCGAPAHAHHADYAEPLAVQWLCPVHHARQHAAEGRLWYAGRAQ